MKNHYVLTLLALLAVLLPVAALADGNAVAEGIEATFEATVETAVNLDDALGAQSSDEGAEPQIEVIPNSMSWAMGKPGSCSNLCGQCPNESCEFDCLMICSDPRFNLCTGEACCGLPGIGFPGCV